MDDSGGGCSWSRVGLEGELSKLANDGFYELFEINPESYSPFYQVKVLKPDEALCNGNKLREIRSGVTADIPVGNP